jgi:hypothetical protein
MERHYLERGPRAVSGFIGLLGSLGSLG